MIKSVFSVAFLALLILGLTVANPTRDTDKNFAGPGGRIVNGTATTIENIPFQVSILYFGGQWCGGAILDHNTILTAAHCFDWFFDGTNTLNSWTVRAGSSYWATGGQLKEIASVVRHEEYDSFSLNCDIAILKLTSSLTYSSSVQPAILPQKGSELSAGQLVQVSGWGRLTQGGVLPDVLQKVIVPVIDRDVCEKMYAEMNPVTPKMFCAGDLEGMGDACNGDSGGPLVDEEGVVYGLVSWNLLCALEGFTSVYVNVPLFIEWIEENWGKITPW